MKNTQKIEVISICQCLKMETDRLYGLIKCHPEMLSEPGIFNLAHGLYTATSCAAQTAKILNADDISDLLIASCDKLVKIADI